LASLTSISVDTLARSVGTSRAPALLDVRADESFLADPRLVPGSIRCDPLHIASCIEDLTDRPVVAICQHGGSLSQGTAARLRCDSITAKYLSGGFEAWRDAGHLLTRTQPIPSRDAQGHTSWVTRERPKIDRIACPWLIRRFVDPKAVFLYVAPIEVSAVAEQFGATPFDIEGVFWSHRGDTCTFDTMLTEFGLQSPALDQLSAIVRGADTARLDLAPQASGFLAASLGLSQLFDDDLAQLEAGLTLYDAMYLWCRDAATETHNWPSKSDGGKG
jgi:rhodanese-related sulfurtransferase